MNRFMESRIQLVGGLGNQLFGYFFGKYLECERGHAVVFDTSELGRGYYNYLLTIESLNLEGPFVNYRSLGGFLSYVIRRATFAI